MYKVSARKCGDFLINANIQEVNQKIENMFTNRGVYGIINAFNSRFFV